MKCLKYITTAFFTAIVINGYSQQEEVRVVKPYTPTLSGAEKIAVLPAIGDSVEYDRPEFQYSIIPKRYETDYKLTPIKPARMIRPALDKLYKSQLTLGGGNYLTPLAELRVNQVRSSGGTFGVQLKHHSMNGQVRLDNDQKVEAGFNENDLQVYGKRFGKRTIFDYYAGADYDTYIHYGVDTSFADSVSRDNFNEQFFGAHAGIGFQSARPDSFHLQYSGTLEYDYFTHAFDQMEHAAVLDGRIDQMFRDFRIGGDIGLSYTGHQEAWDTLLTNLWIIKLNPYVSKSSNEWSFKAGLNTFTEIRNGEVIPHFYVRGKFSFNIVEDVLVPYFGVDGYLEENNYRSITRKNPYLIPGLAVEPTNNKILVYAGLKGKITDYLAWNIRGQYRSVDNQYFFATDTTSELLNQFNVVYDDMSVMNVYGELNIAPMASLKVLVKGNYYYYEMSREDFAWYKPAFDAGVQARYNMGDKILADAGLFLVGPRYYPAYGTMTKPGQLEATIDLNLGFEYRYTKLLSFWLKFNNITAQPYYQWNNYPSYRFRFMAGFTYGL